MSWKQRAVVAGAGDLFQNKCSPGQGLNYYRTSV